MTNELKSLIRKFDQGNERADDLRVQVRRLNRILEIVIGKTDCVQVQRTGPNLFTATFLGKSVTGNRPITEDLAAILITGVFLGITIVSLSYDDDEATEGTK
jgi:hypothetical protein